MPKAAKASVPPTAEALHELRRLIDDAHEPKTAAELIKLLAPVQKLAGPQLDTVLREWIASGVLREYSPKTAKGKPRYWNRDLASLCQSAVQEAIQHAEAPATAKELAGKITGPIRFSEADVQAVLERFLTAGSAHSFPPKGKAGKPRYWHQGIQEATRRDLEKLLSTKGPQKKAQLQKVAAGVSVEQFERLLQELLVAGKAFVHPPVKGAGPPLIGGQPPVIGPYLKEVEKSLAQVVSRLTQAGVSRDDLRRALVQLIESAGISFGGVGTGGTNPAERETASEVMAPRSSVDLIAMMKQIEPGAERGALVGARELRRVAGVSKAEFDRTALELSRQGRISLHRHDFVASLTEAERDELVTDGAGAYFIGMALRQNAG